jgi:hypothetical protein
MRCRLDGPERRCAVVSMILKGAVSDLGGVEQACSTTQMLPWILGEWGPVPLGPFRAPRDTSDSGAVLMAPPMYRYRQGVVGDWWGLECMRASGARCCAAALLPPRNGTIPLQREVITHTHTHTPMHTVVFKSRRHGAQGAVRRGTAPKNQHPKKNPSISLHRGIALFGRCMGSS